jgi:hypothetical protein
MTPKMSRMAKEERKAFNKVYFVSKLPYQLKNIVYLKKY